MDCPDVLSLLPKLYRIASRVKHNGLDEDDLVQEYVLYALSHPDKPVNGARANSRMRDHCKRQVRGFGPERKRVFNRRTIRDQLSYYDPDPPGIFWDNIAKYCLAEDILLAKMYFEDDKTTVQIGAEMGMWYTTVTSRLNRLIRTIREKRGLILDE